MKKVVILAIICAMASLFAEKVKFVTGEWYPYVSREKQGIVLEIITSLMEDMGVEYELEFLPWKRCELSVQENDMTFTFPYMKTEERQKKYYYPEEPLMVSRNFFFYYGNDPGAGQYTDLEALKNYKIGGVLGYHYVEEFEKIGLEAELTPKEEQSIKKLQAGRIDYYLGTELVTKLQIKELFPEDNNFNMLKPEYSSSQNYIFCSLDDKKGIEFLKMFDKKLVEFKKTNKYKELLDKYGLKK